MTNQEIDKRLFELCDCYGDYWEPSRSWADLEPLIVEACKNGSQNVFFNVGFGEFQKRGEFIWEAKMRDVRDRSPNYERGTTLTEAASLALIKLLESTP